MSRYIDLNTIHNECCLITMSNISDGKIDLTITSPPYDNIRDYNGFNIDFIKIIKELYRITKDGGVVVWIVSGQTVKGSETGNSFKQALFFMECGFKLHDTMIYKKNSYPFPPKNRYYQNFEYMFVFCKGDIATYNIQTQLKKHDTNNKKSTFRQKNGETKSEIIKNTSNYRKMDNVWSIDSGYMKSTKDKIAFNHPAIFPEELCERHIITWSNENDLVYDPFIGSGTTAKMCLLNNRNFIGSEISKEYVNICLDRIKQYK